MKNYDPGIVTPEHHQRLIETINAFHGYELFPLQAGLSIVNLPFFTTVQLLEATDFSYHPFLRIKYAIDGDELIHFSGDTLPFHKLSSNGAIRIGIESLKAFIVFYFSTVLFDEGHYRVVDAIDDIIFMESPASQQYNLLREAVRPIAVYPVNDGFIADVTMLYCKKVIWMNLNVTINGILLINSEEIILENMPVSDFF
ncbi:MAG: hypothetical protein V1775_14485 [Bacteroidota bacterium]